MDSALIRKRTCQMPASLQIPINRSKLYRPDSAPDLLARDRLLAPNYFGLGGRVTLVSAPAGYGKSTYVGQCVNATRCSCAWVSLDPEDSELRRFLTYVVAALRESLPEYFADTLESLQVPTLPDIEELVLDFCNELDKLDAPVVLVLDDYHQISASAVHESQR